MSPIPFALLLSSASVRRLVAVLCLALWLVAAAISAAAQAERPGGRGEPRVQMMDAIQLTEFGPPEVLTVERVRRPSPADGEILVRVRAAGVNPLDTQVRSGRAADFVGAELPYIPGFDVSGEVVEVGADVTRFAVGEEVYALLDLRRGGAYAEYAIVRGREVARKPMRVSHEEAASLPLVALTAWQALFDTAELQPGQVVLIHAGAGGVGSIAVQLASWAGATVIATASSPNHEFLRELGADVVIDYRTQRFEDVAGMVDVVLDPIGGDTQRRSFGIIEDGGILVALVGLTAGAGDPERNVRAIPILVEPDSSQLQRIARLVDDGSIQPIVTHLLPLRRAADAHIQSESGRTRGKIVLQIDE